MDLYSKGFQEAVYPKSKSCYDKYFCSLILTTMTQLSLTNAASHGQLSGNLGQSQKYPANTEITDFSADGTLQGFTHQNGRLTVQEPGVYFIHAQAFFETYPEAPEYHNRVVLAVNHVNFAQMQTGLGGGKADYGSVYTGGVIRLQQGDYISLLTAYDSYLWMAGKHTFFGAFKISE
ncbi:hypothetical protein ACROYT_G040363 [Oculina patagonica]